MSGNVDRVEKSSSSYLPWSRSFDRDIGERPAYKGSRSSTRHCTLLVELALPAAQMDPSGSDHTQHPQGQPYWPAWGQANNQWGSYVMVPPLPPPQPLAPTLTEIPQNEYRANGAQTLYIANQSPIEFWVGGRKGIRATDALDENFAGLHEPNARLLESVKHKVSIRIEVDGYASFVIQKYVRRSTEAQESISRRQLATKVAEAIKAFVEKHNENAPYQTPYIRVGQTHIRLEDIYLTEVRHVSRGSLQPVLAYIPRQY
ncbi:hypothetical protein BC629DRAFT_1589789 [Irpex lacteus]|nr:hypothetical protein BC629DRAFT_1589789 [Irpex lacteus]